MKKNFAVAILTVGLVMVSSCATTSDNKNPKVGVVSNQSSKKSVGTQTQTNELKEQTITPEIAGKYAIYAMMASNSYHKKDRVKFPVELLGWIQVDENGKQTTKPTKKHPLSGLAYDIYEKQGTDEIVFAIRGTDSKLDYPVSNFAFPPFNIQYKQMNEEFGEYIRNHPNKKVVVTGHSLGGGLSLSVSVHHGVDAITFDPSPRVFDGLGDIHRKAIRVAIYEDGEVLENLRNHWSKFHEVVSNDQIYQCSFDFGKVSKHRGDYLALGLLKLGATVNKELMPILDALPKK